MSETIAERLRASANAEAKNMCCNGTGECGIDDCRSDAARLGGLDDAVDFVASLESDLRAELEQQRIRAEAAEAELEAYRRTERKAS